MTARTEPLRRTTLMVAMRDGVRLSTDVYVAAGADLDTAAPHPVLLERSPYDVRADRGSDGRHADGTPVSPESGARYFVERGFIVVRQDCRGRGRSEGVFAKYVNEADDGFDTCAWLGRQPWCDGRIATQGVSYSAHAQTAAASVGAPHVAAMVVDSGGFSDAWQAGGRFGGAFELKQATWAYRRMRTQHPETDTLTDAEFSAWLGALPWRRGFSPLSSSPEYEDFLFEQWEHEDRDAFWRSPGLCARDYYDRFPAAPVLNVGSWYDPYVTTVVDNFHNRTAADPRSRLVMGPWTHGARSVTYAGDVDFGPAAALDGQLDTDYLAFKARWLAEVLDGRPDPLPPVSYFLMGGGSGRTDAAGRMQHGGRWETAAAWPPDDAAVADWYLTADQRLQADAPAGGRIAFDVDPRRPVPSRGGGITSGEPFMAGGAFDQNAPAAAVIHHRAVGAMPDVLLPLAARQDVVSFVTEPLASDVVVTGRAVVELVLSSSAPDTDIAAKLVDVYPPDDDHPRGYAMNVTDGMLRVRYRDDPAHPRLMEPGETYPLTVVLPDTANRFVAGHRIRLDIASSNFPRCDVNPQTGNPVVGDRTWQIARNVLHLGTARLRMPVRPAASGGGSG